MSLDSSRLANVIFDLGKKISQTEYSQICESIEADTLSLNPYVLAYKKKDLLERNVFFSLKDGSRVLISEDTLNTINSLEIDKSSLLEFMSVSIDNFKDVMRELING